MHAPLALAGAWVWPGLTVARQAKHASGVNGLVTTRCLLLKSGVAALTLAFFALYGGAFCSTAGGCATRPVCPV